MYSGVYAACIVILCAGNVLGEWGYGEGEWGYGVYQPPKRIAKMVTPLGS